MILESPAVANNSLISCMNFTIKLKYDQNLIEVA